MINQLIRIGDYLYEFEVDDDGKPIKLVRKIPPKEYLKKYCKNISDYNT